ncbi:MAG: type II toxin-antitoxin system RelE/ParE family toxin [Brevundimonas sp.]|uniref:type II toxin-antitoxin system RelE/ParE family toxin n=1 Tax=Brevundimonas sp. TaxID=1871086 RepID=UPI0022C72760|nr:type II toxin-antitoxin system RelE/ParE family toxin [Brevundimonas sp.]
MRVRYSGAAQADLKAIYLYGESTFGRRAAEAYAAGLRGAVQLIADYPLAAPLRPVIEPPVRARVFRAHIILYTVDETGVLILRFRHAQEDWQEHMPEASEDTP